MFQIPFYSIQCPIQVFAFVSWTWSCENIYFIIEILSHSNFEFLYSIFSKCASNTFFIQFSVQFILFCLCAFNKILGKTLFYIFKYSRIWILNFFILYFQKLFQISFLFKFSVIFFHFCVFNMMLQKNYFINLNSQPFEFWISLFFIFKMCFRYLFFIQFSPIWFFHWNFILFCWRNFLQKCFFSLFTASRPQNRKSRCFNCIFILKIIVWNNDLEILTLFFFERFFHKLYSSV